MSFLPNIGELKNVSNPSDGQPEYVSGYYDFRKGGGDRFFWDANTDKDQHNGIDIIDPTHSAVHGTVNWLSPENSGGGVWVKQHSPVLSIRAAGAFPDSGVVADNQPFIQAALDRSKQTGQAVDKTTGEYLILSPIVIDGTVFFGHAGGGSMLKVDNNFSGSEVVFVKGEHSKIKDFMIEPVPSTVTFPAVRFGRQSSQTPVECTRPVIENIRINQTFTEGLSIDNSKDGIVYGGWIRECVNGIRFRSTANDVEKSGWQILGTRITGDSDGNLSRGVWTEGDLSRNNRIAASVERFINYGFRIEGRGNIIFGYAEDATGTGSQIPWWTNHPSNYMIGNWLNPEGNIDKADSNYNGIAGQFERIEEWIGSRTTYSNT